MSFATKFNEGFQSIMGMRTPALMEYMPVVEAMSFDERIALVKRGKANLDAIVKGWPKFADILIAQGWDKAEVKRRLKGFKAAKGYLDRAMRILDPGAPKFVANQVEQAFNTLTAWFLMDAGYLGSLLSGPAIKPATMTADMVPARPEGAPLNPSSVRVDASDASDELVGPEISEVVMDGPSDARDVEESVDVVGSHVHL